MTGDGRKPLTLKQWMDEGGDARIDLARLRDVCSESDVNKEDCWADHNDGPSWYVEVTAEGIAVTWCGE